MRSPGELIPNAWPPSSWRRSTKPMAPYGPVLGGMNVIQAELALIHPSFGIIIFLLHGLAPDIPMRTMYRGALPFVVADLLVLVILTITPSQALWLPNLISH